MKLTVQSFELIVVAALSLQAFAHDKHDNKAHDKGKASAAKAVKGGFLGKGDGRTKKLTGNAMDPVGNYKIVRRRALEAEINGGISSHMFRATGISVYLENVCSISDLNIHRLPSRFAHSPDWMKLAQ